MLKILTIILTFLISLNSKAGTIVELIADDGYPPYSFLNTRGLITGFYPELIQEVSQKLKPEYDVHIKALPWKRGLALIEKSQAFAIFPPYKIEARTYIKTYSEPLFTEKIVFACSPKTKIQQRKNFPEDYMHLKIGVLLGFAISDKVIQAKNNNYIEIIESQTTQTILQNIQVGTIDCILNDKTSIQSEIENFISYKTTGSPNAIKLDYSSPLVLNNSYLAFSDDKENRYTFSSDFILKFNKNLIQIKKSKKYKELLKKYSIEE